MAEKLNLKENLKSNFKRFFCGGIGSTPEQAALNFTTQLCKHFPAKEGYYSLYIKTPPVCAKEWSVSEATQIYSVRFGGVIAYAEEASQATEEQMSSCSGSKDAPISNASSEGQEEEVPSSPKEEQAP